MNEINESTWFDFVSCTNRKRPPCNLPLHTHEGFDFFLSYSGHTSFLLENERIELNPGDYIFVNAQLPHRLSVRPEDNCHMILFKIIPSVKETHYFNLGQLDDICPGIISIFNGNKMYITGRDQSGLLFSQLSAMISYVSFSTSENYKVPGSIIDLQLAASFIKIYMSRDSQIKKRENITGYVEKAKKYIESNYTNDIKVKDVADFAGVAVPYLQRLFVKELGYTIVGYVSKLRIDCAKQLLESTSYGIIDIALDTGFSSRQHFGRVFKKITGTTPNEYRIENKKGETKSILVENWKNERVAK